MTNETITDIIAEMRDEAARADMEQDYSIDDAAEMMREFACRLEAALKRELGDCAKLRDALETLVDLVDAWKDHLPSAIRDGELSEALEKANSALDAPPRNCDRPECATLEMATKTWIQEEFPYSKQMADVRTFDVWLFAPATEGGNNG
jgi:hypothetical protein